jgi:hypothetical protein
MRQGKEVAVYKLSVVKECHEVEQEIGWCSSNGAIILERVGRGIQPMGLHASMSA